MLNPLITSQVKVRRRGSDTKFVAQVLAVGTECDIGIAYVSWMLSQMHCGHPYSAIYITSGFMCRLKLIVSAAKLTCSEHIQQQWRPSPQSLSCYLLCCSDANGR